MVGIVGWAAVVMTAPDSLQRHAFERWQLRCGARSSGLALLVCAALVGTVARPPRPLLLWNATPSSPVGLYRVAPQSELRIGDIAVAWAPVSARRLAAERAYLPFTVPLVKRVGATAGQRVCARGDRIFIDGREAALRRLRDPAGRPMPWWSGCTRLAPGELFLLSFGGLAFDGRYFGVTRDSELVGRASLLWPR